MRESAECALRSAKQRLPLGDSRDGPILDGLCGPDMLCYCLYTCGLVFFGLVVVCENCKEITTPSTSPSLFNSQLAL